MLKPATGADLVKKTALPITFDSLPRNRHGLKVGDHSAELTIRAVFVLKGSGPGIYYCILAGGIAKENTI